MGIVSMTLATTIVEIDFDERLEIHGWDLSFTNPDKIYFAPNKKI